MLNENELTDVEKSVLNLASRLPSSLEVTLVGDLATGNRMVQVVDLTRGHFRIVSLSDALLSFMRLFDMEEGELVKDEVLRQLDRFLPETKKESWFRKVIRSFHPFPCLAWKGQRNL